MRLTPISANAFRLTQYGFVNCYLVREHDGFTLIDTGIKRNVDSILDVSRHCGAQICRILLTHAHIDHVAGLDSLVHLLGQVEVAISRRDSRLLACPPDRSLDPGEPQTKLRGGFPGAQAVPTHFVEDGELYGSLRVLATPGHTPGHMSFLDERDGTLYAGDAFEGFGGLRVIGDGPWYFPLADIATWNKPLAVASAQKLARLPIHRIACGHGPVRPASQISTALHHAQHRVQGLTQTEP
jgi:glyoxylase-like metal-dependent hydrolase (beta-lactamase superfamily II)